MTSLDLICGGYKLLIHYNHIDYQLIIIVGLLRCQQKVKFTPPLISQITFMFGKISNIRIKPNTYYM